MPTSRVVVPAAFLVFAGPALVHAQEVSPGSSALHAALRDCLEPTLDGATLRERLQTYLSALGPCGEAKIVALLLQGLGEPLPDRVPTLAEARVTELLDHVGFHRRHGRPERMLPVLLVLRRQLPDDARLLFAIGEAYGVASPVFDAVEADAAFAQLYGQLLTPPATAKTPRAQTGLLVDFLPELKVPGKRAELGGASERTEWFRQRLLGFRTTLAGGQPIGMWKLRDPRLDELQEDLRVVLPRGVQGELIEVLELMRAIHPDDPGSCYMLAQVHASLGPAFDPARAVALFEQFLASTAAERFERRPDQEDPLMSRDDVARRILGMRLSDADDPLQALRIAAKESILELTPSKGRPEPGLAWPERSALMRKARALGTTAAKNERELAKLDAKIRQTSADLAAAEADYERWKRESATRRRGVADPQPFLDAITSRKELLERLETRAAPLRERHDADQRVLAACQERLRAFDR